MAHADCTESPIIESATARAAPDGGPDGGAALRREHTAATEAVAGLQLDRIRGVQHCQLTGCTSYPVRPQMAALMAEARGEANHDSDEFIMPDSKLTATPFSLVPFSRSPTSRAISSVAPPTTRSVRGPLSGALQSPHSSDAVSVEFVWSTVFSGRGFQLWGVSVEVGFWLGSESF